VSTPSETIVKKTFAAVTYEGTFKANCGAVEYLLEDSTSYWSLDAVNQEITLTPQLSDAGQQNVVLVARLRDHPDTKVTFEFLSEVIACSLNSFAADPSNLLP